MILLNSGKAPFQKFLPSQCFLPVFVPRTLYPQPISKWQVTMECSEKEATRKQLKAHPTLIYEIYTMFSQRFVSLLHKQYSSYRLPNTLFAGRNLGQHKKESTAQTHGTALQHPKKSPKKELQFCLIIFFLHQHLSF